MKQKEVEDVFGGKEEFANADSVASKLLRLQCFSLLAVCFDTASLERQDREKRRKLAEADLLLPLLQPNAPQRTVMATVHISSSCRFGVQMNR